MSKKNVCSICKKLFEGYGNNPSPFKGETCCDECNGAYVIPLRIFAITREPTYAVLFKTNGTVQTVKPKNSYFTLEELQGLVGGFIELYPQRLMNHLIVCDEEGLLKGRPINKIFKRYADIALVGDVLLCPVGLFEEPENDEDEED